MWKWIVGTFVILALVCGGGGYFVATTDIKDKVMASLKRPEKVDAVRLEPAIRGELVRMINAPGSIEPEKLVNISSEVSGQIIELPFQDGDIVSKGDLLAVIDDEDLQARLDAVQAALDSEKARRESAKADRDQASAEFERVSELYDAGDVSRSEYDSVRSRSQSAEANLRMVDHSITRAEANLAQARKDLRNTKILAPMDGAIVRIHAEVGETVLGTSTNVGSVIMELADLSQMLMRAQVDETNIGPVRASQRADVSLNAYPDRVYKGSVRRVSLQRQVSRDGTGYVEVEIPLEVPEGETLYTGLTANVDIAVETLDDILKVPSQAVLDRRVEQIPDEIKTGNPNVDLRKTFTRVVFRLIDGKSVVTPVTVGASDLTHTVIVSGLEEGELVVSGPYKILADLEHDRRLKELGADEEKDGEKEAGEAEEGADPGEAGESDADGDEAVAERDGAGGGDG
jgi:HlyD family secretion protein